MKTSNPALGENTFRDVAGTRSASLIDAASRMTLSGTVNKTGVLLLCTVASAAWTWQRFMVNYDVGAVAPLLMLGAIGGLIGCAAGVAAAYWIASLPVVGGFLEPQVTPSLVAEVFAAVILVSGVGGLYPAWRASRALPAEALRRG